ncbi:MAG: DUF4411 family protein [Chloroflexi bacterium]|nr:DUF4411 family protein [Chloroflexota bacterium]
MRAGHVSGAERRRNEYSFDTSAFAGIQRLPLMPDQRDAIWTGVLRIADEGRLQIIDVVFEEIDRNKDHPHFEPCAINLRQYRRFPVTIDRNVLQRPLDPSILQEVFDEFPGMSGVRSRNLKADPYVLSLVHMENLVVVTEEPQDKKNKLPDACRHFGVRYLSLGQFIEQENLGSTFHV